MTRETYGEIQRTGFFDNYGNINWNFFDRYSPELSAKTPGIIKIISEDIGKKFDLNNIIIMLDLNRNFLLHHGEIVSTHCTDIRYIRSILDKHGIRYKNGIRMTDKKYSQLPITKLIIEDGVAYAFRDDLFHKVFDLSNYCKNGHLPIDYLSTDKKLNLDNKEVVLSGVLLHNLANY